MIKRLFRQMSIAHIGLRMVMNMVKEAEYINTLGLNNLTLIL